MGRLSPTIRGAKRLGAIVVLLGAMSRPDVATAQASGCTLTAYTAPARQVLHCPDGLEITVEADARYRFVGADRGGDPGALRLEAGAVLVTEGPGRKSRFRVLTPHAVASVRGTSWATDVTRDGTAVFVTEGLVRVDRTGSRESVSLGPGDGVDVKVGGGRLTVTLWSAERAARLQARLGR